MIGVGERLQYRCNGHRSGILAACIFPGGGGLKLQRENID